MIEYTPSHPSRKKWWVRERDYSRDYSNTPGYIGSRKIPLTGWSYFAFQVNNIMREKTCRKERTNMLLTKYKIQEMIEKVELDINDVMHGLQKHDEAQEWDNSHAFVAGYVEQLVKDAIIDQLGRM